MSLELFATEKPLFGLISLNVVLEVLYHLVIKAGPFFNSLLPLLQSVVAAVTVWHLVQKWLKNRKSHEKNIPPPGSGAGI